MLNKDIALHYFLQMVELRNSVGNFLLTPVSLKLGAIIFDTIFLKKMSNKVTSHFVGNKARGGISKRVLQENKERQIFRKTNISYPLIRTRTCAYQGVRNVRFSENLACFVFL